MKKTTQKQTFERWLTDHAGIFYKLVRLYARGHHDQEDLFQDIVIQVWNSIPNFNATAKESTYVYQVSLFAAMAWNQKEKKRTDRIDPASEMHDSALFIPAPVTDPRLEWLYEHLSELPVVDRSLMLLLLEGYSYREIANLLGLSESNVGSRLTRLKKKIANHMENV